MTTNNTINWNGKLEAVHEDGRVVDASVDWSNSPDNDGDYWLKLYGETDSFCAGEGSDRISPIARGWHIRNTPTHTADEHLARMEALVRKLAKRYAPGGDLGKDVMEARAIVALLPEPVDGDLVEARELVASNYEGCDNLDEQHRKEWAGYCRAGSYDDNRLVVCALAAIKRGRALERGE